MQNQLRTAEQSFPLDFDAGQQVVTNVLGEQLENACSSYDQLKVLIEMALVLSRATGAAIALCEGGEVVCRAAIGTLASDLGRHIDARSGLLAVCLRTTEVVSSQNLRVDSRVDHGAAAEIGAESAIVVPIRNGGVVVGVLEVVSGTLGTFDERAVRNLTGLAGVFASAIVSNRGRESCSIVEITARPVSKVASAERLSSSPSVPDIPHPGRVDAQAITTAPRHPITKLALAVITCLLALTSSWLLSTSGVTFLRRGAKPQQPSEPSRPSKAVIPPAVEPKAVEIRTETTSDSAKAEQLLTPGKNSGDAEVTDIRFSSSKRFTEVAVDLSVAVPYQTHRFHNPERIYFDLHSTTLGPALGPWGKTLNVGDKFLVRIRVAQHALGLTRVVLDTKEALAWSTTLTQNPPRLLIRVGGRKQDLKGESPAVRPPHISLSAADGRGAIRNVNLRVDTTRMRSLLRLPESGSRVRTWSSVPREPALRAIYLTGPTAGSPRGLELIASWRQMGGNAIVFDIKDNTGLVTVPFTHPLNDGTSPPIADLRQFIAYLHSSGLYAIGRIAVFQDERLAAEHPELAIRSRRSGRPWKEKAKLAWVDPSNREVQQYNLALAKAAAVSGLDEVQLDYIRFPVQGNQKDAQFEFDSNHIRWRRSDVITHFVAQVYSQLHPMGVRLSLDVFGVLAWNHPADLASTGQDVRAMLRYCDVVSPMIYPSHFFHMDGYSRPGDAPRHFIAEAMKRFLAITAGTSVLVRPWLQGFAWHTSTYSTEYVLKQIRAAQANGGIGYLFWNAENEYREPLAALSTMRSAGQAQQNSGR